jgi:hypothetical protein
MLTATPLALAGANAPRGAPLQNGISIWILLLMVRLASPRSGPLMRFPCRLHSSGHCLADLRTSGKLTVFRSRRREAQLCCSPSPSEVVPLCADYNRVIRYPGFPNCKCDSACPVTIEYPSDFSWNLDVFRLDIPSANAMLLPCSIPLQRHSGKLTHSGHDWVWVVYELAHSRDAEKVALRLILASYRHTRSSASRAAETHCLNSPNFSVSKVSQSTASRLCLKFGVGSRFQSHFAPRARAIALTLQRAIAPEKIA